MTFKELLKIKDMTASRLSRKIGKSEYTVYGWVHGRNYPKSANTIQAVAEALEETPEKVIDCLLASRKK